MKYIDAGPSPTGWSRLSNVLKCPRYYALNREHDRTASDALVRGSLMHIALAHHYAAIGAEQRDTQVEYLSPEAAVERCVAEANCELHDKWKDNVIGVYHQYAMMYPTPSWRVQAVEEIVSTKVRDDVRDVSYDYTARIDLIVAHHGKHYFVDHKTSFMILRKTYNKYTLSGQFLGQQMMGREMFGDDFGGVILNLIGWDDKKPVSSFKRKVLPYAERSVALFPDTVIMGERMIADFSGRDAFHWPGAHRETACQTTYGPCSFFDTCKRGGHYE